MAKTTTADRFATDLMAILGEVEQKVVTNSREAVRKSCVVGRREVKAETQSIGLHEGKTYERYLKGWSYTTRKEGELYVGEIGNKNVPGLPHLLEKGHAKMGGGRVEGREHIAPAADKTFIEYEKQIRSAVKRSM